ncbi:MAG: ABC transporter substrate-binding protein [Acidobacteria bacterium]|nr:ABC transporter substrate-binding protein [Acidobacteriota bacterium]
MKRSWILVLLLLSALAVQGQHRRTTTPRSSSEITIGALFSLTGDGATLGQASAAALDLARRDINQELAVLQLPYHVTTVAEDTALQPSVAAQKMSAFAARGIGIVLGPQTSAEAAAVRPIANEKGMIVVSQGSTASSLAIAGDNLFRLAPNDRLEGAAQAKELRADHIDVLVPLWRADAGNSGLHDSTKRSFEAAGGIVTPGASYDPTTTDFTLVVNTIAADVRAARAQHNVSTIAVYLASFEEAVGIMNLARLDPDLAAVRWYGADGVTQSQAILDDPGAAAFATTVSFTAPNVGLNESVRDRWQPISDEIAQRVGFKPDALALSVYDAAWVSALAAIEVDQRPDLLRESFVRNVQRYFGLTGPTALDAAGDRKIASFDFWTVRVVNGVRQWVLTSQI